MSGLFKLNGRDVLKGVIVAVLSAALTLVARLIESKGLSLDMSDAQVIVSTALASGLGYLIKNLATDENDRLGGRW